MYGRQRREEIPTSNKPNNALLFAAADSALYLAERELAMVGEMCPILGYIAVRPAAQREVILTHLCSCDIFQFVSHG